MGFRFRKSIRLIPGVHVNVAKKGISLSLGGKGLSLNLGKDGVRKTIGLPGSGASYSDYTAYKDKPLSGTTGILLVVFAIVVIYYVVTHN